MLLKNRFEDFSGCELETDRGNDRLRRLVYAALALYLLPAAALVFAVGGVLIAASGVAKGVSRVASKSIPMLRGRVNPRIIGGAYRGSDVPSEVLGRRSPVSTTMARTRRAERAGTDLGE